MSEFLDTLELDTESLHLNWSDEHVKLPPNAILGGWDWDNVGMMGYIRQGEHLDSRQFGVFPVDGCSVCDKVDGKSRVTVYDAWETRME